MKFTIDLKDPADAQRRIDAGFAHQGVTVENGAFTGKGFVGAYYITGNLLHVSITECPFWASERWIRSRIVRYLA